MKRLAATLFISILFSVFFTKLTHAVTLYTTASVENVFAGDGKVVLVVAGENGSACYFQTGNKSLFVKPLSDPDSSAILSLLLTAKATGKTVNIAYYDEGNLDPTVTPPGTFYDVNNVGRTYCTIRWVMMEN